MEITDGASEYRIVALPGQVQVRRDGQAVYAKGIPVHAVLSLGDTCDIGLAFIKSDEHRTVTSIAYEGDVIVVGAAPVARPPWTEAAWTEAVGGER